MNVTVTHGSHVWERGLTAIAVLTIAAVVALVLVLSMQRWTTRPVITHVEAIGAGETAAWNADAAKNRSRIPGYRSRGEAGSGDAGAVRATAQVGAHAVAERRIRQQKQTLTKSKKK